MIDIERERERERERQRNRRREKQAPCREPDVGLDPGTPEPHPGPKAGAKPLSHPGIPCCPFSDRVLSPWHGRGAQGQWLQVGV